MFIISLGVLGLEGVEDYLACRGLIDLKTLLRKIHFITVGKGKPQRLTSRCEVSSGSMYDAFYHVRLILIIRYVACYLSQRLLQTTILIFFNA